MTPQVQSLIITLIITVVPLILTPLLAFIGIKLHTLIDTKVKNEKLKGILDRLNDTAFTVVQSIEQTVVSKLDPTKPLADDGKAVLAAALAELKTHLGQKGLDEMKTVLGYPSDMSIDKILTSYLEAHVHAVNQAQDKQLIASEMVDNLAPLNPITGGAK